MVLPIEVHYHWEKAGVGVVDRGAVPELGSKGLVVPVVDRLAMDGDKLADIIIRTLDEVGHDHPEVLAALREVKPPGAYRAPENI